MNHKDISSVSEPWLLLPLIYTLKARKVKVEYNAGTCRRAIKDLINNLPNKKQSYNESLKKFVFDLYGKLDKKESFYFIDKTPRYYYIIPEIAEIFPNAKFIFLFRNPLGALASVMKTWNNDTLDWGDHHDDFNKGIISLVQGYEKLKNKSIFINYESLVARPEASINKILNYLNLDCNKEILNNFISSNLGKMGDPKRNKESFINPELANRWKTYFNDSEKNQFAINYISTLPNDVFKKMNYSKAALINELKKSLNSKHKKITLESYINKIKQKIRNKLIKIFY